MPLFTLANIGLFGPETTDQVPTPAVIVFPVKFAVVVQTDNGEFVTTAVVGGKLTLKLTLLDAVPHVPLLTTQLKT